MFNQSSTAETDVNAGVAVDIATSSAFFSTTEAVAETDINAGVTVEIAAASAAASSTSEAGAETNMNRVTSQVLENFVPLTSNTLIWDWASGSGPPLGMVSVHNAHYNVIFSPNLCDSTLMMLRPRAFFLVQLSTHDFLVESIETLPQYLLCGKPLVTMAGHVINNYKPFLGRPHPTVDVYQLFNVQCVSKTRPGDQCLNVWQLFNMHKPSAAAHVHALSDNEYLLLAYLFVSFVRYGELAVTPDNVACVDLATSLV